MIDLSCLRLPSVRSGDDIWRLWGCACGDVISTRRRDGVWLYNALTSDDDDDDEYKMR